MSKTDKKVSKVGSSGSRGTTKTTTTSHVTKSTAGKVGTTTTVSFQVKNSYTGNYIMREAATGKFISSKSSKPFKGITIKSTIKAARNPSIDKSEAEKAEDEMLVLLNSSSNK